MRGAPEKIGVLTDYVFPVHGEPCLTDVALCHRHEFAQPQPGWGRRKRSGVD